MSELANCIIIVTGIRLIALVIFIALAFHLKGKFFSLFEFMATQNKSTVMHYGI